MASSYSPFPFTQSRPGFRDKVKKVMINFPTYTFQYVKSLFPIISWLPRYNLTWFTADLIAGLTIGAIVIPQGMAYALIAKLTPEYGLYSSFVGVGLYCLFATSKDVSIGPTSVMALLIGQTIERVRPLTKPEIKEYEIAATLTLFAGLLSGMIGIFRLGVLVELIPGPVIAGFATGSSINIAITQIPQLMGISIKDKEGPAYLIEKETLTELNETNVDAAIGFLCLFYLYLIKFGSNFLSKRYPRHEQIFFFISILRNISIIIFATFASWLIVRGKDTPSIHILGDVPSGFKNIGPPITDINLVKQIAGRIPVIVLILIMEHIAIAKNFGKINHYKINPSQEIIAIGATNVVASFFGAFPSTGAFTRTAIKAKSGVRTPLAGIFTALLVLLTLFYLTPAFYYIPKSALAGVVIHAVLDVFTSYSYIVTLYKVDIRDLAIFATAVFFAALFDVENSVYVSTALALLILIVRFATPRVESLGRLSIPHPNSANNPKYAFVPLGHPSFSLAMAPPDGVIIFRFEEALTYPNSSYVDEKVIDYIKSHTRNCRRRPEKKGDLPWNEPPPKKPGEETYNQKLPRLRAIVFDFSAVSFIDSTGLQALMDIRKELNNYAAQAVEYHFANILDEKIQDILVVGGFSVLKEPEEIAINGNINEQDEKHQGVEIRKLDEKGNGVEIKNIGRKEKEVEIIRIEADGTTKSSNPNSNNLRQKTLFHLTLEEAVSAAAGEDAVWPQTHPKGILITSYKRPHSNPRPEFSRVFFP